MTQEFVAGYTVTEGFVTQVTTKQRLEEEEEGRPLRTVAVL